MVNIRKATINDVTVIQKLDQQVFISDQKHDPDLNMNWAIGEKGFEYFSALLENFRNLVLLAEEDKQVIGYLAAGPKKLSYRMSKCAEIYNMGVSPNFRSKGIGSMLIQKTLKWAKENGFKKMYVSAYFKNFEGVKFYKKNGFSELDLGLELTF